VVVNPSLAKHILRTPPRNDTREEDLFRVVSDIRTKRVDRASEMTIRALDNLRFHHGWSQRCQDRREGGVVELSTE